MTSIPLVRRLGAAIRAKRERLGMSQEAFADAIGMHRTYYSAIERGERNITVDTLKKVAVGLGARPSDLFSAAGE